MNEDIRYADYTKLMSVMCEMLKISIQMEKKKLQNNAS